MQTLDDIFINTYSSHSVQIKTKRLWRLFRGSIRWYHHPTSKLKPLAYWIDFSMCSKSKPGQYCAMELRFCAHSGSDAILINATLNCLAPLIRSRPSVSNRILNAILNFNPLKLANSPMTPTTRVLVKSMEKTTRILLINANKRQVQVFTSLLTSRWLE